MIQRLSHSILLQASHQKCLSFLLQFSNNLHSFQYLLDQLNFRNDKYLLKKLQTFIELYELVVISLLK